MADPAPFRAVLKVACPACGQQAGSFCRKASGRILGFDGGEGRPSDPRHHAARYRAQRRMGVQT